MDKTGISPLWKIIFLGGCAFVAFCGVATFALILVSVWQSPEPPVYSDASPSYENVPQQQPVASVDAVLAGHRWRVSSPTLGTGVILEADFMAGGNFAGMLMVPPEEILYQSQPVNGRWTIAGPLLYMEWDWVWDSGPYHEQIPIEITSLSQNNVQGVDESWNLWQFERID